MKKPETRTTIARTAQRIAMPSGNVVRPTQAQLAGMYVGQVKTGGITAGSPGSGTLGTGTVTVYRRSGSSTTSGGDIEVVTVCPLATPAGMWVQVVQDRFGTNWMWRDLSWIKGKADSGISVNATGTISVWEGGSDTGNNVTATNAWASAFNLTAGDEVWIAYDWAEEKWFVVDGACA